MELKRILAADVRAATDKAVKLYGDDVLIVSNTRVGFQTELVVAVEIASEPVVLAPAPTQEAPAPRFQAATTPASVPPPLVTEAQASRERERMRSQEIVALVREELADLRREFRLSQSMAQAAPGMAWSDAVMPLVERLRECAMPGALRTLLLDSLQGQEDLAQATQVLREQLVSTASAAPAAMPSGGVHVLVGPSGAGKSTMAARLAQWGVEQFGAEQVALISYRDLRAGAWSQAQMLGAHAGVQVFRALDAATLTLLLEDMGHRALVVIDTAGVQMTEHVQEVVSVCPKAQVHAVMAADASEATCRRVLKTSGLAFAGLMLSKLDEADAPWALLQFLSNEIQPPARSLLSRSDRLAQALQIWSAPELVDHALRVSGLVGDAPESIGMSAQSLRSAAHFGALNG